MLHLNSFALPAFVAALSTAPATSAIPTLVPAPPTSGIVAAADGTIYFVDSYHQTVWRVQPGRAREAFVTGRNGRSLQIDDAGNVYGTHSDARGRTIVWRADPEGVVSEVARPDVPAGSGHAFVIHDRELIGFTGSGRIGAMTRTADGDLLVTSGASIRRISATGEVTTIIHDEKLLGAGRNILARLLGGSSIHLTGIAVGQHGDIYVANGARDAVVRIDAQGRARLVAKSDGGWRPTGVVAAHGLVYVLEYGNGVRVRRIATDGIVTVVAQVTVDRLAA